VHTDNAVSALVQAWGPSLVLLAAVSIAALIAQKNWKLRVFEGHAERVGYPALASNSSSDLSIALDDAASLNGFDVTAGNDPNVRLEAALRFTPSDYQVAAHEISQRFREGRVISIDLGKMDRHHAARLVDFCSGMTVICSGWIFRLTDSVVVLTPPS
jgi:hypothetical protein